MLLYKSDNKIIKKETFSVNQDYTDLIYLDYDLLDNDEKEILINSFNLNHSYLKQNQTISHKLREEGETLYVAMTLNYQNLNQLSTSTIKFIITETCLICIKTLEIDLIEDFDLNHFKNKNIKKYNLFIFSVIIRNIIDNLAKLLEDIGHTFEEQNSIISNTNNPIIVNYKLVLETVTILGNSISKTRESLISMTRMIMFLTQTDSDFLNDNFRSHLNISLEDLNALSEHANFLSSKASFLLDATLGLINIEQNNIIKIFSVTSVIFTPPTLIASMYGMNFKIMPELNWDFGYIYALVMIILSAWLPYKFFKKKKWL